ncbi:MAG: periplasmic heavy metal sensor, partial [Mesorhizobium sp.]
MSARLFAASLVLNVFLIGAVAGGAGWLIGRSGGGYSLESAGGQLPASDRKVFRQALREVRRESRAVILDGQQARREAANLLQQPTLDANALHAWGFSPAAAAVDLALVRRAIRDEEKLDLAYRDEAGRDTQRIVRP